MMLCHSSFDAARGTRRLRVYNQQAQLQSASEAFPSGLSHTRPYNYTIDYMLI